MRREKKRKRKQERKTVVEVPTLVCPQTRTLTQGHALACTRSFEVQMRIHQKTRKKKRIIKKKKGKKHHARCFLKAPKWPTKIATFFFLLYYGQQIKIRFTQSSPHQTIYWVMCAHTTRNENEKQINILKKK